MAIFSRYGRVLVDDWMGFWRKRDLYVFDRELKKLKIIPQESYYVGIEAEVEAPFSIYNSRDEGNIISETKPGEKIMILLCSHSKEGLFNDWYLLKMPSGITGWIRLKSFYEKVKGLPWAD